MTGPEPNVAEALRVLRERLSSRPEVLVVTGSGLGGLAKALESPEEVPFADILGFPRTAVGGHPGRWVQGVMAGRTVLLQAGRFHSYEGHSDAVIATPLAVAVALGARVAILTNAAGGIRADLLPGTIVVLEGHLDLRGRPLRPVPCSYDSSLISIAETAAGDLGLRTARGWYAAVLGPAYETPAEVRMLERLGADVVGMSTAAEAVAAIEHGIAVLGLSLVTNLVAGPSRATLSHEAVLQASAGGVEALSELVRAVVSRLP